MVTHSPGCRPDKPTSMWAPSQVTSDWKPDYPLVHAACWLADLVGKDVRRRGTEALLSPSTAPVDHLDANTSNPHFRHKIHMDKRNEAVQWFGLRHGCVVLNIPMVSNNNPQEGEWFLWLGSFALCVQVCLKFYNLHLTCCPWLQELLPVLPGRQTPQNSLLPPEFSAKSTETVREQGIREERYKPPPVQEETWLNWTFKKQQTTWLSLIFLIVSLMMYQLVSC